MEVYKLDDYNGGWFIGNFDPSVFKTDAFEVCFKKHKKGEKWNTHYHKLGTEINYLIRGTMTIQGVTLSAGNVFVLKPMEVSDPIFLEDCELIVVKTPSIPGDKYDL
jgi:hypothetical protein